MTNTTMKKTMFDNKKMTLAFLAVFAACLLFVLFAGANTVQAATSANTAKESASTEKKLKLLGKMGNDADEKTITLGESDLQEELGVSASVAKKAKNSTSYAKKLLAEYGYEKVKGNVYETEYPYSRVIVIGDVSDREADISVTNSGVTFLQYDSPEKAATSAADFEDDGYETYGDQPADVKDESISSNNYDSYEYDMMNFSSTYVVGDETVVVAILEAKGVNTTVLDENRFVYEDGSLLYYDAAEGKWRLTEGGDHGTKTASTVILNTGSNVKIFPIKTAYQDENGKWKTTKAIQEAAFIVAEEYADIVNMSYTIGDAGDTDTANEFCNALEGEINTAISNGVTFIAAAGNDAKTVSQFPGCYEDFRTISAIDSSFNFASFSSGKGSNYGSVVDFCAPGKDITVINSEGTLTTASGTSFSAPLVAACAAQLTSAGGKYDADYYSEGNKKKADSARYTYFQNNCLDLGLQDNADYEGCDFYYGFGLVTMTKYNLENAAVSLSQDSYTYTGSSKKPTVTVSFGDLDLSRHIHYSVSYSNYTNIGTATVTVSGLTSCTGSQTVSYTINPEKPVISSLTSTASQKAKITYTQSKQGGSAYRIYYRKAGSSSWNCASTSNKSYTFTKLTSGATYEFRIRAYKTVSGTTYYSDYSSIKTVTVI